METADVFLGLHDFLDRMRHPSAADIVKSIKSFFVSFSNNAPDPEKDSAAIQAFFNNMEATFRAHPLWNGCSEEELESAGEGLEKYVMTKLYTRVFASAPDDVKIDEQLSEKMALVQQFVQPENLDIKPPFQNETSWLLAQKELQKINMCKAPRDKLVCILNCCKVINNLLHNVALVSDDPFGADEFLPVLIYVTIKANPPQLHSNLLYIQRYRRQSRLVAEAAYFFTNMLSAESFISNIDAKALSMDATEYEKNMESAQALLSGLSSDFDCFSVPTKESVAAVPPSAEQEKPRRRARKANKGSVLPPKIPQIESKSQNTPITNEQESMPKVSSLSDLENKGAAMLLKEDQSRIFLENPYLFAHAGDLTINDVEELLSNYKQIVLKYICLAKGLGHPPVASSDSHKQAVDHSEASKGQAATAKEPVDTSTVEMIENSEISTSSEQTISEGPFSEGAVDSQSLQHEAVEQKIEALQVTGETETVVEETK